MNALMIIVDTLLIILNWAIVVKSKHKPSRVLATLAIILLTLNLSLWLVA